VAPRKKPEEDEGKKKRRPAITQKGREDQLAALAVDLAEKQLAEGTATSQVITHYLKLASTRELLEQEKLANENELLRAKVEQLASMQRQEELYAEALLAMRAYSGQRYEDPEE
jgi:hypothetical protein